jgi:hypothetical protein
MLLMLLLQRRGGRRASPLALATLNNWLLVMLVVYVLLLLMGTLLLLVQNSCCHRHRLFRLHQIMLIRPSKSEWIMIISVEVRFRHRLVVCIELYPPRRLLVLRLLRFVG